jgi:N-hydroxyarylamine O-acetyltransferase
MSEQADADYRLAEELEDLWVLRRRNAEEWTDLYAFSGRPALPIDFEVANHFTSTYPESIFRRALTVQRSSREDRRILRNDAYTVRRGAEEARREVQPEELEDLLPEAFGLELTSAELEALQARAALDSPART